MMAVAAAQKNREMFAIKKSYSIEVSDNVNISYCNWPASMQWSLICSIVGLIDWPVAQWLQFNSTVP